jgi:hypothetical protein
VDGDCVEPSNLNRQHYFPKHLGRPKVEVMAELLRELRPAPAVETCQLWLDAGNIPALLDKADFWLECLDDAKLKALFVSSCLRSGRSVIGASGMGGFGGYAMTRQVRRLSGGFLAVVGAADFHAILLQAEANALYDQFFIIYYQNLISHFTASLLSNCDLFFYLFECLFTDARHLHDIFDTAEISVFFSIFYNVFCAAFTNRWQQHKFFCFSCIDIDFINHISHRNRCIFHDTNFIHSDFPAHFHDPLIDFSGSFDNFNIFHNSGQSLI